MNQMGFMEAVESVFTKYAVFSGRARRKEYWYFVAFNMLVSVVLGIIGNVLHLTILPNIYSLVVLVPGIAVAVRRLHDTGKTGWLLLVTFIPIVGGILLLVWMCSDGTQGQNQYGDSPKYY